MPKAQIKVMIGLGLSLILFLRANASADLQFMKLLTPKIGWVATESELFWTTDTGANWQNITPEPSSEECIVSVYFLNTTEGWVLRFNVGYKNAKYNVAYTNNSGATWSIRPVKLPSIDKIFDGNGSIYFVDSANGWLILNYPTSARGAAPEGGIMLETHNGGNTWKIVNKNLPATGSCRFVTENYGWLADDDGFGICDSNYGNCLYITFNGGNSWKKFSLNSLFGKSPPSSQDIYGLPQFYNKQQGYLPVIFNSASSSPILALFVTNDGGKTWEKDRVLNKLDHNPPEPEMVTSTMAGSVFIIPEHDLTLLKLLSNGKTTRTVTSVYYNGKNISQSEDFKLNDKLRSCFVSPDRGWVLIGPIISELFSTIDGGITWKKITPSSEI